MLALNQLHTVYIVHYLLGSLSGLSAACSPEGGHHRRGAGP